MGIMGDRGEYAWITPPIENKRFADESEIDPELAKFLNSPKFTEGFRGYRNGKPVELEPPTIDTPHAVE